MLLVPLIERHCYSCSCRYLGEYLGPTRGSSDAPGCRDPSSCHGCRRHLGVCPFLCNRSACLLFRPYPGLCGYQDAGVLPEARCANIVGRKTSSSAMAPKSSRNLRRDT